VTEFSQIKSPEWLENQPFGQMPYLEDTENGFVIYESRAIVKCTSHLDTGSQWLTEALCDLSRRLT
jgi:glutathione S-transferase